jgi:predicted nuclease with TOPRIM domain
MPMQAESLEVLEKASVAPAQARAIVRAIELEIAGAKDTLATKHDLLGLQQGFEVLRREFEGLKREFEGLKREFEGLKREFDGLKRDFEALKGEFAGLKRGLDELRAELHRSVGGVVRQMYLAILGQMAVLLGFAYFFATHLR